jgi:pyruvate/2-oxoglutarate dehydrogenase complex dihydrolipoamide acyltransferase (E2) component
MKKSTIMIAAGIMASAAAVPSAAIAATNSEAALSQAESVADQCPLDSQRVNVHSWVSAARLNMQSNPNQAAFYMNMITKQLNECASLAQSVKSQNERCRGGVRIGMTSEEIRRSAWCEPTHINTTITAGHRQEQWVYEPSVKIIGDFQPRGYLYLTDDVLTAIQEQER